MTEARPPEIAAARRAWWLPLGIAVLALGWPVPAGAVEYEIFVDIDDEEELNDLQLTDQISEETYETLIELLRKGTDLDKASRDDLYALPNLTYEDVDRILAYRAEAGRIADPADLVVAGVLTQRKLAAIAAFLVVPDTDASRGGVSGHVRYRMAYVAGDPRVPPMALQGRIKALGNLTAGAAALLDPQRLGPVAWDPNRAALVAEPEGVRPRLPKAFVQWDTARWGIIAGNYRIGFGQRLTFDDSRRYTPNGFYLDDAIVSRYKTTRPCNESAGEALEADCDEVHRVAPSYRISPGLRGVAAGAKHLPMPVGWMQVYGFWSMQNQDVYQYRVYDRGACQDPSSDDPECNAPTIYKAQDDPLAPTTKYIYRTLPNVVDLITQGGNVSWFRDERSHVGVTGYGSLPRWRVEGADLDFAPSERFPGGGAFGAVGADFSWGRRWSDLSGEVSRSFDGVPFEQGGGGGFAAIVRHTSSWKRQELEVTGRYYDTRYANPYSRPISARDRYEGNQARDEAGVRVRYTAELAKRVDTRNSADFWVHPSNLTPNLRLQSRTDVEVNEWWRPGLWVEYQNNDLASPRFSGCVDESAMSNPVLGLDGDAVTCGGQRLQITARSRFQPIRRLSFTLQYRHEVQNSLFADTESSFSGDFDDGSDLDLFDPQTAADLYELQADNRLRQDIIAILLVAAQPTDALRIRGRVRWFWEDIADNSRLEHSLWAYLELTYKIRPWAIPSLRYDVIQFLDTRDSTLTRVPNPEHWIRFQFESRF